MERIYSVEPFLCPSLVKNECAKPLVIQLLMLLWVLASLTSVFEVTKHSPRPVSRPRRHHCHQLQMANRSCISHTKTEGKVAGGSPIAAWKSQAQGLENTPSNNTSSGPRVLTLSLWPAHLCLFCVTVRLFLCTIFTLPIYHFHQTSSQWNPVVSGWWPDLHQIMVSICHGASQLMSKHCPVSF